MPRTFFLFFFSVLLFGELHGQEYIWRERHAEASGQAVGINPRNPNAVFAHVATGGNLIVSYDRGSSWATLGFFGTSLIRQIAIHPADTTIIFCVGGGLYRSSDYGSTWDDVLPSFSIDGENLVFDPVHPDTIFAGDFATGGVYRSTDRGVVWQLLSSAGSLLCALAIRPDSVQIMYAGTSNGTISKSTDGGFSWRIVAKTGSVEIPHISIDFSDPLYAYASSWSDEDSTAGVWRTTDGGELWEQTPLRGISMWAMDTDMGFPATVYSGAFTLNGQIGVYRSMDHGVSWDTLAQGLAPLSQATSLKVHPLDPEMIWLAPGGVNGIYRWTPSLATIEGVVLDEETGEPVANGFIEITETQDLVSLDDSGGHFTIHYYEGDPSLTPVAHVEAYPYYVKDETLEFVLDSVVHHDILLTPLRQTAVTGNVVDSISGSPLSALVRVLGTTSIGGILDSVLTDPDGSFEIDSLYVSYPPIVSYDALKFDPDFPHAKLSLNPVVLDTTIYVINALIDTADVMLTSSSESGDFSAYYEAALDSIGLTYHVWDPGTEGVPPVRRAVELRKRTLVYYTGNQGNPLLEQELDSLEQGVLSGANMFISGQNFVELNQASELLSDLLHVSYGGTSASATCRGIDGDLFSGLFVLTAGGTGAGNQISRDILQGQNPNVVPTLYYGTSVSDEIAAVRLDSIGGGAKVVLFGFGFEAISAGLIRESVMEKIIGYFDGSIILSIDDHTGSPVTSYRLEQNYPNPFNPSTTISFSVPHSGDVSLKIFNLLGEEVATLVSGQMDAGNHAVSWDAAGEPSGVYFYRLEAGGHVETRKLVLLR